MTLIDGEKHLCSAHGSCNAKKECECQPGWAGIDCSQKAWTMDCSSHGYCHNGTGYCADG